MAPKSIIIDQYMVIQSVIRADFPNSLLRFYLWYVYHVEDSRETNITMKANKTAN